MLWKIGGVNIYDNSWCAALFAASIVTIGFVIKFFEYKLSTARKDIEE